MMGSDKTKLTEVIANHYINPFFRFTYTFAIKSKKLLSIILKFKDADSDAREVNDLVKDRPSTGNERALLKINDVPQYLRFNPWIRKGYRSPKLSTIECIQSLGYFHNETINILTHVVTFVYFLVFFHHMLPWNKINIPVLLYFHYMGCVSPWLGSSIYHIFMNHKLGERIYYRLLQWDVIGIWITQSFGASTTIYTSVVLYPLWFQKFFIGMYVLLSLVALIEGLYADRAWKRPASFASIFIMRIVAFGLRLQSNPLRQNSNMQLLHITMQELWPLIGAFISVTRIPERFWPGNFDYFFNSHNIMHCFVVFGAIHMHMATYDDLLWLSNHFGSDSTLIGRN